MSERPAFPPITEGIIRLSPSALETYLRCGEKWRRRYIERDVRRLPTIPKAIGSAVHRCADADNREKLSTGKQLARSQAVDVAVAHLEAAAASAEEIGLLDDAMQLATPKAIARAKDTTASCAGTYMDRASPLIDPIGVELPVVARLEVEGRPVELSGVIDVATADGIRDLKTGGRRWTADRAHARLQLSAYGVLYCAEFGEWPTDFTIDSMVYFKSPTRRPEYEALRTARGDGDYAALLRTFAAAARGIEAGVFLPAEEGSWMCSAKWCEYFGDCPFVNPARRATSSSGNGESDAEAESGQE